MQNWGGACPFGYFCILVYRTLQWVRFVRVTLSITVGCPVLTASPRPLLWRYALGVVLIRLVALTVIGLTLPGCIPDGDAPAPTGTAADLAAIELSPGTLSPGFDPAVTSYTATISSTTTEIMVTATTADPAARLTINNLPATSGQPFGPIVLEDGPTTVSLVVEPPGNQPLKSYTVVITRSGLTDLASLVLSAGDLTPAFTPQTTTYAVSVPTTTTSTSITATTADATSVLRINNQPALSGQPFGPIALAVGGTAIAVTVSAPDGTTKTYTVTVNRAGPGNANLGSLTLSAGALSPAFNSNTTAYSVSVPNATTSTTVTAVVQVATSTMAINGATAVSGSPFGPITLNVGANPITIVVRANDGVTLKTYTVTVVRAAPPLSSNANLSGIVLSVGGTLQPPFNPNVTSYEIEPPGKPALTFVTATTQDPNATLTINGLPAQSGVPFGPIALSRQDETRITIVVRAQNLVTTKTYKVDVER